jgi:hypothetical protein
MRGAFVKTERLVWWTRPVTSVDGGGARMMGHRAGMCGGRGGNGEIKTAGSSVKPKKLLVCSSPIKRVFWLQWPRQVLLKKRRDGEEC